VSTTAEFVKAEVLAKLTFSMSEKDPTLCAIKAVANYYSLHRYLKLESINGKSKKAVKHLVSVIKSATLKTLIEVSSLAVHNTGGGSNKTSDRDRIEVGQWKVVGL
jgi:hypothetical protein